MNESGIDALLRVAHRISEGQPLTSELMGQEGVPVPLRILVAVIALTAADQPVSKSAILTAAPAARSATYRDHADLLDSARALLPALVKAQLGLFGEKVSVAELASQLQDANRTICMERERRERAESDLAHVVSYARELHWKLKPERDELLRERAEKVRVLRPVPAPRAGEDA